MSSNPSIAPQSAHTTPAVTVTEKTSQTTSNASSQPVELSLLQRIWQGFCSFVAALFRLDHKTHNRFNQDQPMAPTAPMRALQKPTSPNISLWSFGAKNDSPFAEHPEPGLLAPFVSKTPEIIRCGTVAYKVKWYTDDKGQARINYDDADTLAYNRALFIAHTRKLLTGGGMQASRPQLHAAAELYQVNIVVWSRDARSNAPWSVADRIEPAAGPATKTVDLCLYMKPGEGSHYRVLADVEPVVIEAGLVVSYHADVVEAGGEGECLYLALGWALNRPDARLVRMAYNALCEAKKAPASYVSFFKSRSDMLTQMHNEISTALSAPDYAERIDAEVQDAIQMQLRRVAQR